LGRPVARDRALKVPLGFLASDKEVGAKLGHGPAHRIACRRQLLVFEDPRQIFRVGPTLERRPGLHGPVDDHGFRRNDELLLKRTRVQVGGLDRRAHLRCGSRQGRFGCRHGRRQGPGTARADTGVSLKRQYPLRITPKGPLPLSWLRQKPRSRRNRPPEPLQRLSLPSPRPPDSFLSFPPPDAFLLFKALSFLPASSRVNFPALTAA